MSIQFWNPFSSEFLKTAPDHAKQRAVVAARNSFGIGEDPVNWNELVTGYSNNGLTDPAMDYNQNNIIFETLFTNKWSKISWYRNMSLYPLVAKALNMMADEAVVRMVEKAFMPNLIR